MSTFAVSDAVLDAYLTQARRDVEQGDIEGISLPVRALAAILDECSRWRHGEFWDTATAFKSRAEAAEAELAAARAENKRLREGIERLCDDAEHEGPRIRTGYGEWGALVSTNRVRALLDGGVS